MVLERAYGWADSASRRPVDVGHRFRIASVSKPITAVAILTLVERGQLGLDDRPFEVLGLSSASGREPDARLSDITVRQLLRHRGGFDRARGLDPTLTPGGVAQQLGVDPPLSVDQIISFMLDQPLDFDPGGRESYSNFGYAVLGRMVERVTGQGYEEWVRNEVLSATGVGGMVLARPFPDQRPADEVAYYHPPPPHLVPAIPPRDGQVPLPDGGFDLDVMAAHGGWIATASDLVRFALAVDGSGSVPDVLGPDLVRQMLAPPGVGPSDSTYYGMGWIVEPTQAGEPEFWWHPGDLPGATALLVHSGTVTWALLLNRSPWSSDTHDEIMATVEAVLPQVGGRR